MDDSLKEYEDNIQKLREYMSEAGRKKSTKDLKSVLTYHEEVLLKIREQDPEIREAVAEALEELKRKGRKKLAENVDSYWKGP